MSVVGSAGGGATMLIVTDAVPVFPAASLIPEKVTAAVLPLDLEIKDGPEATAEVVPANWTVPVPIAVVVSVVFVALAGTTATVAVLS